MNETLGEYFNRMNIASSPLRNVVNLPLPNAAVCHTAAWKAAVAAYKAALGVKYDECKWADFAPVMDELIVLYGDPNVEPPGGVMEVKARP
jgi:hypothetical protein